MKTLLVMRHAKSDWDNVGLSDYERPLNGRGKADAPWMGKLLKREDLVPDLIITSAAVRAATTAELAAMAADYEGDIRYTRDFYHADPETYLELLASEVADGFTRVMVVGHNPGMEELVELLTGGHERFTTANIAYITLPIHSWRELSEETAGKLVNLWRPGER